MKLIPISKSVLINPEKITCVEQKNIKGKVDTLVVVEGRQYVLEVDIRVFLQQLMEAGVETSEQYWAG